MIVVSYDICLHSNERYSGFMSSLPNIHIYMALAFGYVKVTAVMLFNEIDSWARVSLHAYPSLPSSPCIIILATKEKQTIIQLYFHLRMFPHPARCHRFFFIKKKFVISSPS